MRRTTSFTSISWIPSEAMTGPMRLPMDLGIGHYDDPPPARIDDLEALRDADRFRFANRLTTWIEVEDDAIVDGGYAGGGVIGATVVRLGVGSVSVPAVAYPTIQAEPERGDGWMRFVQTAGGRTGAPLPRRIAKPPYVRLMAPTAWTTLAVTMHADGRVEREIVGASPFPRHWFYDDRQELSEKSAATDFTAWTRMEHAEDSPWAGAEHAARVTEAESALERELSLRIMREGRKPELRKLAEGDLLTEQGQPGDELFLLLDGVLSLEVDGEALAEIGPGAVLGERALLEGGHRTATLRAATAAKVAVAPADQVDHDALRELSGGHRREERRGAPA